MSNLEVPSSDLDMPTPEQLWQYCDLLRTISRENGRVRRVRTDDIVPVIPGTIKLGVAPKVILTPDERLLLSGDAEYMLPGELDEWSDTNGRLELGRCRRYVASLKSMGKQASKLSVIESDYILRSGVAYEGMRNMFTFSWNGSDTFDATVHLYNSLSATIEGVSFVWGVDKKGKKVREMVIDEDEPTPNAPDPNENIPLLATTLAGDMVTMKGVSGEEFGRLQERTVNFGEAITSKRHPEALERD